ncbi:antibiotic biosynthesis monooxygenase family protein [Mycobacterium sp. NPDC003323]
MTTIAAAAGHATLINVFTVTPERAEALVRVLTEASDQVMRHLPGFISANIHLSEDRTRVINYAQWESTAAYAAIFEDATATGHMSRAAAIADGFEPKLYTVESITAQEA